MTTISLDRAPKRRPRGTTRIVSTVLPVHLADAIANTAQRKDTSISALIASVLEQIWNEEKKTSGL